MSLLQSSCNILLPFLGHVSFLRWGDVCGDCTVFSLLDTFKFVLCFVGARIFLAGVGVGDGGGGESRDCPPLQLLPTTARASRVLLYFAKSLSSPGKRWVPSLGAALTPQRWLSCLQSPSCWGRISDLPHSRPVRRICSQDSNSALQRRVFFSYVATGVVPFRKSMAGNRLGFTSALGVFLLSWEFSTF